MSRTATTSSTNDDRTAQTVLIVDDERTNIMALSDILRPDVEAVFATNGDAALKLAATKRPDLVLLDIVMPDMDGYEVCRRLKADPATREIPVVFVTAMDAEQDEARGLEIGAIDYITKPFSPPIVKARVRNHLELKRQRDELTRLTGELTEEIMERKQTEAALRMAKDRTEGLNFELDAYRKRVAAELEMARETQAVLLPDSVSINEIARRHDLEVSSHFEPSSELGGDFWAVRSIDRQRVAFMTVDFSGHGVNAALNTFRLHSLLEAESLAPANPAAYLRDLNHRLSHLLPDGQYATMFYGVIDRGDDSLSFAGAAAPSPMVAAPGSTEFVLCDASGLPLGMFPDSDYDNQRLAFPPGTSLLLHSDAFEESTMRYSSRLGQSGLCELARLSLETSPRTRFLEALMERFDARAVRPLDDDLTAVFITRRA